MILFLDFDGVLHAVSQPNSKPFDLLPKLELFLFEHMHINAVISSAWRYEMTLDQLRELFNPMLRERIIDTTPKDVPCPKDKHWRHAEILAWIALNKYEGNWLAIDDDIEGFPPNYVNLVPCKKTEGLTDLVIESLRFKIC